MKGTMKCFEKVTLDFFQGGEEASLRDIPIMLFLTIEHFSFL
jgi:hypothetical protein